MADIRINALATTAASTASDDFVAVDGSANGTRKLNAYSPTFGGNLTVSGGTVTAIATGGSSNLITQLAAGNTGHSAQVQYINDAGTTFLTGVGGSLNGTASVRGKWFWYSSNTVLGTMDASGNLGVAGNLTVSGTGNSSVAGTWLIGTTTNSGNGKLQLATHTTSAGGIGFGTETQIYRRAAGHLAIDSNQGSTILTLSYLGNIEGYLSGSSSGGLTLAAQGATSLLLATNGTTALTLDSSQNATFAGNVLLAASKGIALNGQTNPAVHGISSSGNNLSVVANTGGVVNLGTASNGALFTLDGNGVIKTQGGTAVTPASASATGTAGMIQWDASYIYVCTATNTWKRVAIATW